jgi:hypothetical protein
LGFPTDSRWVQIFFADSLETHSKMNGESPETFWGGHARRRSNAAIGLAGAQQLARQSDFVRDDVVGLEREPLVAHVGGDGRVAALAAAHPTPDD